MAAKTLTFDTGIVTYDLNGAATVRFNPTDAAFVERLYKVFADLEAEQVKWQTDVEEINDVEEFGERSTKMFDYANQRDTEMRGLIDGLLGEGVSDAVFPDINCYALADGLPVWVNLLFAIAEEVNAAYTAEQKKTDPRVKSYSDKYEALLQKYQNRKK